MTLSPRISAALLPLPNGAGYADARGLNFPQNHTVDGRVLNLSEAPSARLGVPVRLVRPTYRSHPHAPNVLEEALVSLSRPRRPLRSAVLGLAASAALVLAGCSLDQEEEVRLKIQDWVKLGETKYFFSRVNCTAALFDVKATRITSMVKKVRDIESGMRAITENNPVAFEVGGMSPTQVTEAIMTLDLPQGLGVLASGTGGKDCMAVEMEEAYYNTLHDPTSVLIFHPEARFMVIFDRRNMRLFYSRGR